LSKFLDKNMALLDLGDWVVSIETESKGREEQSRRWSSLAWRQGAGRGDASIALGEGKWTGGLGISFGFAWEG
jgi:hypothetical protein